MAASTEIRKAVPGGLEIDGAEKVTGSYVSVALRSVSYYPVDKVIRRIVQSIYGVDLQDGLYSSEKFHQDEKNKISSINLSSPLSPGTAEGYFILFLPVGKPAWGLMDIQKVRSYRPDINLSLISPLALMPPAARPSKNARMPPVNGTTATPPPRPAPNPRSRC